MSTTLRGYGERRRRREKRSRRAVAAALALARENGLPVEEPAVLGDLFSLMVHLRPSPVVARVATCMPKLRTPSADWLGLEIAVTSYLLEQGAQVVGPSRELPPGPHEYYGFAISFWTYVRPDPSRIPTASDCSAMLVDLHAVLRSYPGELPMLGDNDIPRGLELLNRAGDVLSEADVAQLRATAERLRPLWETPSGDIQPLHGDAHPGNLIATREGGLVWIDFEDVCRGPVEWDLATIKPNHGRRCTYPLREWQKEAYAEGGVQDSKPLPYTRGVALEANAKGTPMSKTATVRVVATHDFCCSYLPSPTSYGSLPGGEGLKRAVDRLREQGPTVRADAGDFAAPGALATLSDGKAGFEAAADLDIDVGVVGNHEFEWGVEHLLSHAPATGFPLLCANAPEAGLPPTAVVETDAGSVGFVGLTCPDPEAYVAAPKLEDDLTSVVSTHTRALRDASVEWVVVLFHDGVDWRFGKRGYEVRPERFVERCRPWATEVDVVFASHTLGRWIGRIEGTPVVQPWPFGAELGVVELARNKEPKAYGITPKTGERWSGMGSDLLDEASSRVLGKLERPLRSISGGPSPLADFFALALRKATGARAAAVDMLASQAPMDGVLSYLPAGPVTEADVVRLYPWPDATVVGELSAEELKTVAGTTWPEPWAAWGFDTTDGLTGESATLAVLEGDAAEHVERVLGRRVDWRRTGVGLHEAVGSVLPPT